MRADPPGAGNPAARPITHRTSGTLERFHDTLTARLNLLVYPSPEVLRAAMADFIRLYNHHEPGQQCERTRIRPTAAANERPTCER